MTLSLAKRHAPNLHQMLAETAITWRKVGHFALIEEFVLANGRSFRRLRNPPHWARIKQCFENAALLALHPDFTYVEGFVWKESLTMPIHHAWVLNRRGEVIDNTMREQDGAEYFGVKFADNVLRTELVRNGVYGLLDHGRGYNVELMKRLNPKLISQWQEFVKARIGRKL
jgi:hypothetical protein